MYLNTSIWSFFNDIMKETGVNYQSVYDQYKRDGRKVYYKYLIESGDINIHELNRIFSKYNHCCLEYDFNGDVYAGISQMNAVIKVKEGAVYCILSFIDTVGKE